MSLGSAILAVSVPIILVSILGTFVTVTCFRYRKEIANNYLKLREYWHRNRESMPDWFIRFFQVVLGITGMILIVFGFVFMPLPGPGTVMILAGAGILDLEFGWIIPFLQKLLSWCPEGWRPGSLTRGLKNLRSYSHSSTREF